MKNLALKEWVAVAELTAAVGVIISLLLVVYSLEKNTEVLQAGGDNLLFENHTAIAREAISDPSLAAIQLKVRKGEALSEVERIRWDLYQGLFLDVWAMAYMRHGEGLLGERQWQAWDTYFSDHFRHSDLRLTEARWQELVPGFDPGFWGHVHEAVLEK